MSWIFLAFDDFFLFGSVGKKEPFCYGDFGYLAGCSW